MTEKITVRGVDIDMAVRVEGEGDAVMLLHGFPDSSHLWRHQIDFLTGKGYRVIAPDLRGFGDSDRPEGVEAYSLINVLADLSMMLDHLEVQETHVVGHDFGAAAAWGFAAFAPDRTKSLSVLSVGHPACLREVGYEQLQRSWYMFMFQFEGVAEEWLTRNDFEFPRMMFGDAPDIEKYIEDMSRPGALTAALNWYRANIPPESWISGPPALPPILAPTMGVWSSNDIALTEEQMTLSEKFVQGTWRYERIDDIGHWIPTEAPDVLNGLLLDFFQEAESA